MTLMFLRALVLATAVTLNPAFAHGECSEAPPAQRQAEASVCYAHCDRVFHREETNHACHQECYAQHEACRTNAGSS